MVKVSVRVCSGATNFEVTVRAESIRRAIEIVNGRYPNRDVELKFERPKEPAA